MSHSNKQYDLSRFVNAQNDIYNDVVNELKSGKKISHWMWFIFPQFDGLGRSETAVYYSIKNIEEAKQYLHDPILGERLLECTRLVLDINGLSATSILGKPDDIKLLSSMTLFSILVSKGSIFERVIEKYFSGEHDIKTIKLIGL